MAVVREPLNGGVVQTKHPLLLRPGELQKADECILRPADPALYKAPGHTVYGTVRSTSISTATANNTSLTSGGNFGTDIASVTTVSGFPKVTSAAAFGSVVVGQYIVGTGIPAGTFVKRVVSTSELELTANCTASAAVTVTVSNLRPGMYITGTYIPLYTTIASITNSSALIMSAAASGTLTVSRTFSSQVQGLRALSFDQGFNDVLLAKADDTVYTSPLTTITGTFTALKAGLSQNAESMLETIQYKNRHIYLTGYDRPRVLYYKDSGSNTQTIQERALGMAPVTGFVGATTLNTGSWSSLTEFQNGYYYFLVTEVLKLGPKDEVESTFIGTPKFARITTYATQSILVTYTSAASTPVNDGTYGKNTATHWRVYMAPQQSEQSPTPDLAAYVRMAEVPISVTSVTLSDTNPSLAGYSGLLTAVPTFDPLFTSGSTSAIAQTAKQTIANCTLIAGSNILQYTAGSTTITAGMYLTSTNNYIPYSTTVQSVVVIAGVVIIYMSAGATVSSTTETVGFSTNRTFDFTYALAPRDNGTYRKGLFQSFGLHTTLGGFTTGTITGIKVEVQGWYLRGGGGIDSGFQVSLMKGGVSGTASSEQWLQFKGTVSTVSLGGQFDTWGLTWVPSDFADGAGNFGVLLKKNAIPGSDNIDHLIDGIRVTVYAGGNTLNLDGVPFRVVTISDQLSVSFGSGANGPPPIASTGDVFDGMVLLNDTNDESAIVASLPDEEEAFPDVYRLPLESKENDRIRVIRKLNNIVVIGCLGSVKRLNYFPKETDAEFTRGRCYEDIATDHGMVGPRAARIIDLPGHGTILAYLSHNGLRFTDGITSNFLNEDIDWNVLIEPTLIQRSVLEVYPRLSLLALYYVPLGQTRKISTLYFSYHPTHIKEGGLRLPAVGPVSVETGSSANLLVGGKSYLFTGHSMNGKVYVEDSGTVGDDGVTEPHVNIRTRQVIAAEIGYEARVERVFLIADAAGDTTLGGFTASMSRQNKNEAVTSITPSMVDKSTAVGGMIELFTNNAVETFAVSLTKGDGQEAIFRVHYLTFEIVAPTWSTAT